MALGYMNLLSFMANLLDQNSAGNVGLLILDYQI